MTYVIKAMMAALLAFAIVGLGGGTTGAQETGAEFSLTANAAYCEPGYPGPFVGCTPWDGVTVSFTSEDGTVDTSCVTQTDADARSAWCTVEVPFGASITASIDAAAIPDGYVLEQGAVQTITIPDSEPDGVFGGPAFVLLPAGSGNGAAGPDQTGTQEDVDELPTTGRGTGTTDVAIQQSILTALVLAAVAAGAFGGMALMMRRDRL